MSKEKMQALLSDCCEEVLDFIKSRESIYTDGFVPATEINEGLGINFSAVPKNSAHPDGQRGWLFATFARMLEDQGRLVYEKRNRRSFYKRIGS